MYRITRLPGAAGLLTELSVTGITDAERIVQCSIGELAPLPAGSQGQLCTAMSTISIARKQRLSVNVQRNAIFGFLCCTVRTIFTDTLGGFKLLRWDDARPTLCANAAVDALAGHYDYEARRQGIQIEWKLELPKLLSLPEADLCTILGNLLENALHASQKLPPEERQIKVLARMLSPAMMGLMVENRYDGVLKKQGGVLHSTKHDGQGIGLVSVETAVHRYHGNLTVETGGNVFRANVLLNL